MTYSQYFLIVFLVSNPIVYLIAGEYIGKPGRGEPLRAALRRSFELRCTYKGVGEGDFVEWFRQIGGEEKSVNADKPGHFHVQQNEVESILTIKIFVEADSQVTQWYVKTKNGMGCQFGQIAMIPSPQGIEDDRKGILDVAHESIRRSEDQSLNLKCIIEPFTPNDVNRIQWEFSPDNKVFTYQLPDGITKSGATIQSDSVQKSHRGYYRCKINDFPFTVLLRVKDKLAALWPFIGIVSIVLTLVIIIIIFEKRQKSNKKTASTDDDEQDRASDPLVRTTIKTSDNDSKKRAVKA